MSSRVDAALLEELRAIRGLLEHQRADRLAGADPWLV